MPAKAQPQPPCPKCGSTLTKKHSPSAASSPRVRCETCGKVSVLPTESKGAGGRPALGDRALTNAEHQKKHREKTREKSKKESKKDSTVRKPCYDKRVKQVDSEFPNMAKSSESYETPSLTSEQFRLYCRQRKANVENLATGLDFQTILTMPDGSQEIWTRYTSPDDDIRNARFTRGF